LRVTGGTLRSRRLRAPPRGVRPTSDRVRESLFAVLGDLSGSRVLDLYAGTGALGIEALSRGAEAVDFVERAPASLSALRANLESLGLAASTRVVRADVRAGLRRLAREGRRYDLVLLDPPYGAGAADAALAGLAESGLLAPGATVVVETARRHPVVAVPGLAVVDARSYGDTLVTRLVAEAPCDRESPAARRSPAARMACEEEGGGAGPR
jgi:16S rRNA (guanine966-N2)-methyltransferase